MKAKEKKVEENEISKTKNSHIAYLCNCLAKVSNADDAPHSLTYSRKFK